MAREAIYPKKCAYCGKPFLAKYSGLMETCCSEKCTKELKKVKAREKYLLLHEKPKSNRFVIAEIESEARSLGLSYGQYVGKRDIG